MSHQFYESFVYELESPPENKNKLSDEKQDWGKAVIKDKRGYVPSNSLWLKRNPMLGKRKIHGAPFQWD